MATLRYTNGLLTAIAILLALHLWTMWAVPERAAFAGGDFAATPFERTAHAAGIPNAGQQRKQMVDLLKKIATQSDDLAALFTSGRARVRVEESRHGDPPNDR